MSYWDKEKGEIKSAVTELEKIANDSTEQTCERYKNLIINALCHFADGSLTLNDEATHTSHGYKTWYKGYPIYIIGIKLDDNDGMQMECTYTEDWDYIKSWYVTYEDFIENACREYRVEYMEHLARYVLSVLSSLYHEDGWEFIVTMPKGFTIDFKTSYETYNRQIAGGLFKEYIKNNIDKIMAENKEKILQSILNSVDIGQVKEQTY